MENMEGRIDKVCKDCGQPFYITKEKAEHLKANGMQLFERCWNCRTIRREKNGKRTQAQPTQG